MTEATTFGSQLLAEKWDNKDVDGFLSFFADNAVWCVNTSPPVQGKEGLKGLTEGLMAMSLSSKHFELVGYETPQGTYIVRGKVAYTLQGKDEPVVCTFCDILERNVNGKVAKCWTFMDVSPLSG